MKYVSRLAAVNNYYFKFKKPHSFQGAAPNIPNTLQAIDLGLGLENLHCRPSVRVRVRVTIRVRFGLGYRLRGLILKW